MLALLAITITIALLALIVYGLHKYQTIEVKFSADRTLPLPPLDQNLSSLTALRRHGDRGSSRQPKALQPAARQLDDSAAATKDWQKKVSELKQAGDLSGALIICQDAYPLWRAYNQACILIRGQLRSSMQSVTLTNSYLTRLYNTAALAELLHDKSPDFASITSKQRGNIDMVAAGNLSMSYADLGYTHLRLIGKGDIRLMHSLWGRPDKHQRPRILHRHWWAKTISQLP